MRYTSDMSEKQWKMIRRLLKQKGYRSIEKRREQINAILYLVKTGCQWRNLPKDFPNPWGLKTPKGEIKMMSQVINFSVFPGQQGGPLEHVIAAKAVAFEEALSDSYTEYAKQVQKNAKVMAQAFMDKGYKVVSGGTDNHCMLIDLRTKFPELTGKKAENTLVKADITINKNMVPFDSRSPFQTSGIRVGTPAITTRGLKEEDMKVIVDMIDRILSNIDDENVIAEVKKEVNAMMNPRPMFAW